MAADDKSAAFTLDDFLPFMLNQAAERVSRAFQDVYQKEFGLSRTQWRLMAHLYAKGGLTAKDIAGRIHEDKVSISRAVAALEAAGRLTRKPMRNDRRYEQLHLTADGKALFVVLSERAHRFEADLVAALGPETEAALRACLRKVLADPDIGGRAGGDPSR